MIRKILCKVLTLGRHRWTYGKNPALCNWGVGVYCKICRYCPNNQWELYKKKFLGKPKGTYKVPTNTNQIFRGRKNVATRKK